MPNAIIFAPRANNFTSSRSSDNSHAHAHNSILLNGVWIKNEFPTAHDKFGVWIKNEFPTNQKRIPNESKTNSQRIKNEFPTTHDKIGVWIKNEFPTAHDKIGVCSRIRYGWVHKSRATLLWYSSDRTLH